MDELKPCPFCGGEVVVTKHHNRFTEWYLCSCKKCHISQTGSEYGFRFKDIKELEGYNDWMNKTGYCLDKDMKIPGNKVYRKAACMFVPASENIREVSKRHPNITKKANEANQTKYVLEANGVTLLFDSEKSACEFLGVKKCSVSSCYHKGYKCKGYRIAKMDGGDSDEAD